MTAKAAKTLAPPSKQLTVVERAALALNSSKLEKDLVAMAAASVSIVKITNDDGYKQCHAARMALRNARVEISKVGKDARDDALKFQKGVIAEEARLIAIIEPEEKRLQALQDAVDAEVERLRQEKIEAEKQRAEALQAQISAMAQLPASVAMKNAEQMRGALAAARTIVVNHDTFAEFTERAELTLTGVVAKLELMVREREEFEAEAERQRITREEQRAEAQRLEAIRVENERVAQVARDRQAEEDRRAREQLRVQQEQLAEQQRRNDEETARLADERAALEAAKVPPLQVLGIPVVLDESLPHGTVELRSGDQVETLLDLEVETPLDPEDLTEELVQQFLGWLTADIAELHGIVPSRLLDSWERFKATALVDA